jgi:hypothetical protein
MSTVPQSDFDAFKSSVVTDLTALRTSLMTTQSTLDVDAGVATDTFAAQAGPPPLVTVPGAAPAGGVWFPSVVNCLAAVPGAFSLANSGVQIFAADGVEILRIWATDPSRANYNAGNLYIGAESGASQPVENAVESGWYNVALGPKTLKNIVGGSNNVAVGTFAMDGTGANVMGSTAVGAMAMRAVTGINNSAFGSSSLLGTSGNNNNAFGYGALLYLTTGSDNVALGMYCGAGYAAAFDLESREFPELTGIVPDNIVTTDSQIVIVGTKSGRSPQAGPTEVPIVNAIAIGYLALYDKSNTAVIGNAAVTDVYFGSTAAAAHAHAKGLTLSALPTAVDGLAPGTLWNNAGVVNVAP